MDISDHLLQKSKQLLVLSEQLKSIQIDWHEPISVHCCKLNSEGMLYCHQQTDELTRCRDLPAVYFFKITNGIAPKAVVDALKKFKVSKGRSCPKIEGKRSLDSQYLYCGSVKANLHGRLIQHFGRGHRDTYALQLSHWAKDIGLELEYYYGLLRPQDKHLTELIESSLAMALKPLVGKIA